MGQESRQGLAESSIQDLTNCGQGVGGVSSGTQDSFPRSCGYWQNSFPGSCETHCGLLLQGKCERLSAAAFHLWPPGPFKGLPWFGRVHPGPSPFWWTQDQVMWNLRYFCTCLQLCHICNLSGLRYPIIITGSTHVQEEGIKLEYTPGFWDFRGHLKIMPALGRQKKTNVGKWYCWSIICIHNLF